MLELPNGEINDYQLQMINQWTSDDIAAFKSIYEKKYSSNPKEAKECLNTIYEYRLKFNQCSDLNISKLHKAGIDKFSSNVLKNRKIEDLIQNHNELIQEKQLRNYINKDKEITQRVNNIKNLYKSYINKDITKESINDDLKQKEKEDDLIAIAMSTLKSSKGIILRDSQIFSLIILLNKKDEKGKLIQVFSGEGKTIITFCLAIILVLKGHKVDIICYDEEFAKRDSKEAEKILEKLNISVGNNIKAENDCYKKDVLYGSITTFQGGIMRDGYYLNGERQDRKFDIVIVDEIDCMLLDDYDQSTGLISPKPFLERYSIYLLILWGYYRNLHLNRFDVNKNENLKEKLSNYLTEKIKNLIKINDNKSEFFFPMSNLIKNFALDQVPEWVSNLIKSLSERKNVEYIIKDEEIIPVDFGDTGTIRKDKKLKGGLQQFLQMQNNLPVTPISTNTSSNSLSNYGFFQNYRKKEGNFIFGTTDAVGSIKSRELLEDIYGIDFDYIPTNDSYLLRELTSNISLNHESWLENIINIIKREINSERGVLLLCETVEYCEEIYEKIRINFPNFKLIKIIGEDNEINLIPKQIEPKTVIISTDVSGRGIEFKVGDKILKNGGLHIIFSFISPNSRVEEKNYKKKGKAGDPGTYQYVLDFGEAMDKYYIDYNIESHYIEYQNLLKEEKKGEEELKKINTYSIENIKKLREERVNTRCNNALDKINNIKKEDLLFNIYCSMVDEKKELREIENRENLKSIEEQWGIFQYSLDIKDKTLEKVKSECDNFKKNIFGEYNKGKIIKNPGYYNQYINEKLRLVYNYVKSKNILAEMKENNFQAAKTIFAKNEEKTLEYDKYIEKCDSSIELDNYSFIPYYLKGMCKILSKKNGVDELKKSLFYIEEEIKRYFYIFGLLRSLDINIDLLFYQINILNSIKVNVIQRNIEYCNQNIDLLNNGFNFYSKDSKSFFYLGTEEEEEEEEKDSEKKYDKIFPKYLKQYYSNLENNGLKKFFFFENVSSWKLNSIITTGIIMIGLSISGISNLDLILTEEVVSSIEKITGVSLTFKEYEDWIKKKHEKDFPFSTDKTLTEYIRNNNIKIKNTEYDLEQILKRFDKEYQNKIRKETEKLYKKIFLEKIKKLNIENIYNLIEKNGNEVLEENITNIDIDKYINNNLKSLDENKRKTILANNFMRRDGRDWLTDETKEGKDINTRIQNANKELDGDADKVIIREIEKLLNKEIESKKEIRDKQDEEIIKQKEIHANKKKVYETNLEIHNKRVNDYNNRNNKFDLEIKAFNELIAEYNKDNSKVDKEKIDNDRKEIEKTREELNKEREEINKSKEQIDNEAKNVNKENDLTNKLIDEFNVYQGEVNERIKLFNDLKNNLTIDFSKDELKIIIKKNDIDMPNFYSGVKQIEKESNIAFKDELKRIAKFEEEKENIKKIIEIRNEFEMKLLKIIKEKNNFWDNCFNKAFYALNYIYNSDDMERIMNYLINQNPKRNDYYYIKDITSDKSINEAKDKINQKKIILGNNINQSNYWNSYCILPHNNSNIFLYKSSDGNNPPEHLVQKINEITSGKYVAKINKIAQKKEKGLSEVDAIENGKIIIEQIEKNKNEFVDKFEKYPDFYKENKEVKEKIKQKTYPEQYIMGLYDEIKKENNDALRISIVFFKNYFLNEDKDNEIDIEFLNKIYNILLNYNNIDEKEKEILKKEYGEILNVYNNVYVEIKKQEEEEQKEVEEIVQKKGKRKHNIKNIKNKDNPKENNIRNDIKESEGKRNSIKIISEENDKQNSKRELIIKNEENKEINLNNFENKDVMIYNDYNLLLQGPEIKKEDLEKIDLIMNKTDRKQQQIENKEENCCERFCNCFKKK